MNTKLATHNGRNKTCATTKRFTGRKPVLGLLRRLLWAVALVLSVFGAKGAVVLTTLYTFGTSTNGANPAAPLVQGNDGYFYGTTANGGAYTSAYNTSFGTVFKISTNGALMGLYSFTGGNDGGNPVAALVRGSDGYFYGTTYNWGANQSGTVFKIDTNGSLTILYEFPSLYSGTMSLLTGTNDGANPTAALIEGSDGNFYGTTSTGGNLDLTDWFLGYGVPGIGTVFEISTHGALTNLYVFGINDSGVPNGLIQGSNGLFYGTASGGGGPGSVFEVSSDGTYTNLYFFTGGDDGGYPVDALVQGSDGFFYGTTEFGGPSAVGDNPGYGTVFKIATNGSLTTLYSFTGGSDGGSPTAALVLGSDGDFYGTTSAGGDTNVNPSGYGTVFKISTKGALTTLYSFTGLHDGGDPNGLIQASDGSFYGTTQTNYPVGGGTVFRLTIVPDPQLTIVPSEANVVLTWPTNYQTFSYAGYTLQTTTNLGPSAVWTPVSSSPAVTDGKYVVVNPVSGAQQFFRLSQ